MLTTRKNQSVKALQSILAKGKKRNALVMLEWLIACNTNNERGHVYDQHELNELYARDNWSASHGATKTVHKRAHTGEKFEHIVIKRHQTGGYCPSVRREHEKCTGNQLIDEINCWVEFAERPESDLLCPILKYFTSKSDKVTATSETMQRNVLIIAQKAVYVGTARNACEVAEDMNANSGLRGELADSRYGKLKALSERQGWRDAMHNGGNSGVIFDYAKGCYKAVFIDYAL